MSRRVGYRRSRASHNSSSASARLDGSRVPDARMPQRNRENGGRARSSKVTGGTCSAPRSACAGTGRECRPSPWRRPSARPASGRSACTPAPMMPFGGNAQAHHESAAARLDRPDAPARPLDVDVAATLHAADFAPQFGPVPVNRVPREQISRPTVLPFAPASGAAMLESARKPSPAMPSRHALILPAAAALLTACGTAPPVTRAGDDRRSAAGLRTRRPAQQPPSAARLPPNTTRTTAPARARRRTSTRSPTRSRSSSRCTVPPTGRTTSSDATTCPRPPSRPTASGASHRGTGASSTARRRRSARRTTCTRMTAAHPTLPLPSYARVTNVATGKSVLVRVNDRGPFLHDRVIDLSFAAAQRIGIAQKGSGEVEVESDRSRRRTCPPSPRRRRCRRWRVRAERPRRRSRSPRPAPVTRCSSVRLQTLQMRRTFLAHVQNQLVAAQVEAKIRQAGGLFRVYVGPVSGTGGSTPHRGATAPGIRLHRPGRAALRRSCEADCGSDCRWAAVPDGSSSHKAAQFASLSATPVRYNSMLPHQTVHSSDPQ